MIDVKSAVAAAEAFVHRMFDSVEGILLEEVELDRARNVWSVTLSFFTRKEGITQLSPLEKLIGVGSTMGSLTAKDPHVLRLFRRFLVDADSGLVTAMKMRDTSA